MLLFQTQDVFSRYVYGATHAHVVNMCWPLLWGIHQMGCSFATFGTYTLVGSLKWIMRALNSQGLRLWWLHHSCCMNHIVNAKVASLVFCVAYHSLP